jgi:hypothetical protein
MSRISAVLKRTSSENEKNMKKWRGGGRLRFYIK